MMRELVLAAAFSLFLQQAEPPAASRRPGAPPGNAERADLCEVIASGHSFFGHYLEISGAIRGEQPDHLTLFAAKCASGLPLGFSPEVQGHEDAAALFSALRRDPAGAQVSVDLEGSLIFSESGAIVRLQVDRVDRLTYPKR